MPDLRPGTVLALSGGGFRATLFHAGALIRINELGLLRGLSRISSVSGGSIAAGRLAVVWSRLTWQGNTASNLLAEVITPLRDCCARDVDRRAVALAAIDPFSTVGDVLSRIYGDELLEKANLKDLPESPRFIFNATNLRTGRLFRISRAYLADYRIGRVLAPDLSLGRVVAASSAFPPILSPVVLDASGMAWERTAGADLYDEAPQRAAIQLTDGGVYDNLGLETVDDFERVLVSDAGAPFSVIGEDGVDWLKQPMRALDIATDQARALRKRHLLESAGDRGQKVALWAIDTAIEDYEQAGILPTLPEVTTPLARIRTRLNPFGEAEQGHLMNWGYALADAALRRFAGVHGPDPKWPVEQHRLDR